MTVLHKLCIRPDAKLQMLEKAIKMGADVNATNNFNETCLMFSAKKGSNEFIDFLIKNGGWYVYIGLSVHIISYAIQISTL